MEADDLNEPIRSVCDLLNSLNRDLARMSEAKIGSTWHFDRVAERARLRTKLRELYREQDEMLSK